MAACAKRLARSDWQAALAAIRKMGDKQRSDSRWTYFEARLLEMTGDKAGAQAAYQRAAREPQFHGFLAADRINQPYALCPWIPHDSDAAKAAVARDPAIVRAMALYRIDRGGWAQREWDDALSRFDDTQRRLAVEVAQDNGWFDRAVFALGKQPRTNSACTNCASRCTTTPPSAARQRRTTSIRPGSRPRSAPKACSIRTRAPAPTRWA